MSYKFGNLILIAFLVGCIHFLPQLWLLQKTPLTRIHYPFSFSELLYAAQVQEIAEGHVDIGDPQFWEHKYIFPSVFPYIPVLLIALLSSVSGNSVVNGFYLSDFLFPALLFLSIYGFSYTVSKDRFVSMCTSLFVVFLIPLVSKMPPLSIQSAFIFVRSLFLIEVSQLTPFYRTPNPQISFIFLILALWSLYILWKQPSKRSMICTFITGSLLFSVYFYHVTYFLMVLGVMICFTLLSKDRKAFVYLLIVGIVLCTVGLIYYLVSNQEIYKTLHTTGGKFDARYFDWIFTFRYGIVLVVLFLVRKRVSEWKYFYFLVLGAILVIHFQLFVGWTMQPGHWIQTTIEPIMTYITAYVIFTIFKFKQRIMYAVIILGFLMYGLLWNWRFVQTHDNHWNIPKDLDRIYTWIRHNTEKNSVVVSLDIETLAYLPVLTSSNIFLPVEEYHYATIDEIWERILYAYKIYQVSIAQFDPKQLSLSIYFEQVYNINAYKHLSLEEYSPETVADLLQCYPSLCSTLYALPSSVDDEMKRRYTAIDITQNPFRVHYAIYSDREASLGAKEPMGEVVFVSGNYKVYHLTR